MKNVPVSAIVLTYNEESNIRHCLGSLDGWAAEVFIVDSYSTDRTLEIAREYTPNIYQNPWSHGAGQRQWALANLPLANDWILFLDADERLSGALKEEIGEVIAAETRRPRYGGFYLTRKFIFLGQEICWGGCRGGLKELRLCHRRHLSIGERAGWEIYICRREVGFLKGAIIHEDKKPISAWIARHDKYASLEAQYLWNLSQRPESLLADLKDLANDSELYRKEAFRGKIWHRLPTGFRPALLFCGNYFFRLGFLDGAKGFIYHFLHDFWYRLMIDAKLLEIRTRAEEKSQAEEL
jgi:glycosyltransferase involved in cell wall biosynthesis